MTRQDILDTVIDLIEDVVLHPIDVAITEQSVLTEIMDSLDFVELSLKIDTNFGISTDYQFMKNMFNNGCTVSDIVDLIIKTKEEE